MDFFERGEGKKWLENTITIHDNFERRINEYNERNIFPLKTEVMWRVGEVYLPIQFIRCRKNQAIWVI